uniref:DM domain-containing protein n=1 Tax=Panagrolaimus sp. JU765 TaxID=591449 RepID=A0AC34QH31_9BILA
MGSNKGKQLFCRRCEGHGAEVILKGHGAFCPYMHCKCDSCERLRKMRENAFIRRYKSTLSKTEVEAALNRRSTESRSSTSSSSDDMEPFEKPQPFFFEKIHCFFKTRSFPR